VTVRIRITLLVAIAFAFIALAPDARATARERETIAYQARVIHSLQVRNNRQARMIRHAWRTIARLRAREIMTRDEMLVALELMPVTLAELEQFAADGMTGGRIYLGE
jgi:hypothetical protein